MAAEAEYDSAYTFIFSPRPGTEAAAHTEDFVPAEVAAERFERLRHVVERSALIRHQARLGHTEEVLVEGLAKKGGPGVYSGRSRQNKLVHFAAERIRPGTVVEVHIDHAAPHFLKGKLVRVLSQPAPSQPHTGGLQLSSSTGFDQFGSGQFGPDRVTPGEAIADRFELAHSGRECTASGPLALVGPTASGKSALGVLVALQLGERRNRHR